MNPLKRLSLLFQPIDLGLDSAEALTQVIRDVYGLAASRGLPDDDATLNLARALLLELQVRALMREDDAFSATGQVSTRKDVARRVNLLRRDIASAYRAADLPVPGDAASSPSTVLSVVTTFGG